MIEVSEYVDGAGKSPFEKWFLDLKPQAAARVTTAILRMEQGNLSNLKSAGKGVLEYRIDYSPGYRIYLGRDGEQLIILLGGGTKKRQQQDIEAAQAYWQDYKLRKRQES